MYSYKTGHFLPMIKAILLLSPMYVTLFWSIIFFLSPKTKNNARHLLGVFMLFSFILFLSHAIFFYKHYFFYIFFESLYIYTRLALFPLFYIYLLFSSTFEYNKTRQLLHFIPSIVFGILSFVLTLISSPEERFEYINTILISPLVSSINLTDLVGIRGFVFILSRGAFIIQAIIYLFMGISLINKHNKTIDNYFSDTENRKLSWVKTIGIIGLIVSIVIVGLTFLGKSFFLHHELSLAIPSLLFTSFYFVIGYQGYKQKLITIKLYDTKETEADFISNIEDKTPEAVEGNELKLKLITLFENDNISCQQDLKINTIAEKLNTNRTYVSRLINEEFGMNFNEFVNKYRIEKAKEIILSDINKKYTLEYVAEKSGFGSVASFLRVFKKIEGTTPGKFRTNTNLIE